MARIDAFLKTMIEKGGSDLHLCSSMQPKSESMAGSSHLMNRKSHGTNEGHPL